MLGPLAVSRGGVPVDVGGPNLQAVLVTLVHHLDEVVPVDTLVDALWGGDPPKSARNAIQVHISRLRRVLGPSFDLRTVRHGYSLTSAGIELDSADFERLGESAVQRGDDDPTTVVDLARAALSLWRGIPAADELDIVACAGRLVGLRERRIELQAIVVEAQLELGQHRECCAEAEALADEHPFREDIRVLHLLALYRSGRQAEALAAYRRTRNLLVEELGVEPGPELRSVHHKILAQDQELDPGRSSGTDRAAEPIVRLATDNLRPEPNTFVERPEIDRIIESLTPGRVVTAVGTGGIGKSRCVGAAARRCHDAGRFADGLWLIDLAPLPDGSGDVGMSAASAMGLGQQPDTSFSETVVGYLAHRQALVVLDNCEHVASATAAFVDDIVAGAPGTTILAASRIRLGLPAELVVTLDRLPDDAARQLLVARIAETGAGPFPDQACAELCASLDNYPLAIELAAARTRALAPREIVARLGAQPKLLRSTIDSSVGVSSHRHADLATTLDWSLEHLSPGARETLFQSTVFVSDFDLDSAEAVLSTRGRSPADVACDLGELVEHHLVNRDQGRARFRVLEPIRQHLRVREPVWVDQRYSDHFAAFAIEAARGLRGPHEAVWWDRLRADLPHVRELVRSAIERGDIELLDRVMTQMAVTSLIIAFAEPGEWAIDALHRLALEPTEAPGVAVAAAIHHAHHKQREECEAILDRLEGHVDDRCLVRAIMYGTRTLNDLASSRWIELWEEAAQTCADPAMRVFASVRRHDPDVAGADRYGNPSLRVFARSFHSAYVLTDRHGDEARRNKQDLYRIALTSNNNLTIAGGQAFMALQHCFDADPGRAAPLAVEMIERFVKGRSPFWIWHGVEMIAVMLAMVRMDPYTSEKLWAGVTTSGTIPYSRLTRNPELPEWVASQLSEDEMRRAFAEGSLLDMDVAARDARKAAEQMATG